MRVGLRPPRDPEAVADRVENEKNKNQEIGDDENQAPRLPRRHPCRDRRAANSALIERDRRHASPKSRPPGRPGLPCYEPATCLMRAIISSTAFSTGTFSLA